MKEKRLDSLLILAIVFRQVVAIDESRITISIRRTGGKRRETVIVIFENTFHGGFS